MKSVVAYPRSLTLSRPALSTLRGFATLAIRGNVLTPAGAPTTLRLYRGSSPAATTRSVALQRTGARYAGTLRIKQTSRRQIVHLRTRGTIAAGTVPCTATFGVTCLSANRAPVALTSNSVRVVIPARPS